MDALINNEPEYEATHGIGAFEGKETPFLSFKGHF